MALTDEIPADILTVLLPVGIGVVFVIVTVVVVFWLGSNRQRSFEEAKAQASRQAAEVLREKEHQNSPRAVKKGRRPPRRPKRADQGGDDSQEDAPLIKDEGQPRKSILKPVAASISPPKEATPERSPKAKVGFKLSTPPKEESKTPRMSPPTPHPSKQTTTPLFVSPAQQRTVQPLFEEPEEEETSSAATGTLVAVKPKKPHPQTAVPSGGKPAAKKPRVKSKQQQQNLGDVEALPASRISDIVVSSSLSDEDIQQLMDVLLEKMNTNAEWQAASMRPENVKTLKKQNQDLQNKFEESQRTVVAHSNKIKELRAEIQNEKMRHQSSENSLQGKITSQNNDLVIARTKISGLEEELKQIKAESGSQTVEKLQQENAVLQTNLSSVKTMADGQKIALDSQAKQIQELKDTNASLKTDIQRAKASLSGEPKLQSRVGELESMLDGVEHEKNQLNATLEDVCRDNAKLKAEVAAVRQERDTLKQQAATLEADNAKLRGEVDLAKQSSASSLHASGEAIRVELERKSAEDVERVRGEMSAQHKKEVEQLREAIAQLEGSHGNKEKEVEDLRVQVDKCSSLEEQLKTISQQLQQEQGSKKELESELESLRSSTAAKDTGNGPVEVTDGGGGEELAAAVRERDELKTQVKQLESKLDDLKSKNNSLRDSLWKAKDEAANLEKVYEEKVKDAHIAATERVKTAKAELQSKEREDQQAFLKQLFPSITVEAQDFSMWLDEFESKVEEHLKGYTNEIASLQCTVEELREKEQSTSQEDVERIRKTLETTRSILEKLQSEVAKQQKLVTDKEAMLEREKSSNRSLQEQLKGEKETSARLQKQLEGIQKDAESAESGRDLESRLADIEGRLKETEQERDGFKDEIGNLRSSLDQQTEAKDRLQQQAEEQEKQLKQVSEEAQQSQAKWQELEAEVATLKQKLTESERKVEKMKNSNRELNAMVSSLSPKHSSPGAESEV